MIWFLPKLMLTFGFYSDNIKIIFLQMENAVGGSIKVWAVFDAGISPLAMSWRNRQIKFDKVILKTDLFRGKTKITNLICTNNNAAYKLEYNHQNFSWTLKKIMPIA